jgi:hypothetical protein
MQQDHVHGAFLGSELRGDVVGCASRCRSAAASPEADVGKDWQLATRGDSRSANICKCVRAAGVDVPTRNLIPGAEKALPQCHPDDLQGKE